MTGDQIQKLTENVGDLNVRLLALLGELYERYFLVPTHAQWFLSKFKVSDKDELDSKVLAVGSSSNRLHRRERKRNHDAETVFR